MTDFYWKQRNRYNEPDFYISRDGQIYGELSNVSGKSFDSVWVAQAWDEWNFRMTCIGRYIDESAAKMAIEKYCHENYNEDRRNEKILL